MAAEMQPRVIAITETHLDASFKDGAVDIPGYRIIRQDRDPKASKKNKGGGVIVYVSEDIEVDGESKRAGEDFELVAFDTPEKIRYVILYRVPGCKVSEDCLKEIEKQCGKQERRLLVGDLNMNLKVKTPVTRALHTMLGKELGMEQKVEFVTRPGKNIGSIIDHVWTNMNCRCRPERALNGLSDHRAIKVCHEQRAPEMKPKQKTVEKRFWGKVGTSDIGKAVKEEMEEVMRGQDPDLDTAIKAWNKGWKPGIKERQQKEEEMVRAEGARKEEAKKEFKEVAEKVKAGIFDAKRSFWRNLLAKLPKGRITDRKEGWGLWNKLTGRKKKCDAKPDCTPDEINAAFLRKVENIREPLLKQPLREAKQRKVPEMGTFAQVTAQEVRKALAKDKGKKSCGIDEIPMDVLKRAGPGIADEIALLVNCCIKERRWPEEWKLAEVVPIWKKKGNRKEPKFYRPVSMLPAIARLVERVLAEQLKEHIRKNNVLPQFQHGFRAKHSTETALVQLIDIIASAMDENDGNRRGRAVLVATLDLAGAFDTIDRQLLIRKIATTCGINGAAGELLQDYLQGRKQRVRKGDNVGGWKENPWGVPQGSVLGPLLFVLFCADIADVVKDADIVQYADDCTLAISAKTTEEAISKMNKALGQFEEWATGNRLAAEPTKTQLVVCAVRQREEYSKIRCEMGGHEIEPTETMKVLGVTIDNRLSWEAHNAEAAGKASGIA
eukprot:gene4260-1042_t